MTPTLLKALQKQLKVLVDDLRKQSEAVPELRDLLRQQYAGARKGGRTGASYEEWREDRLDEAAVAWLLGTVFVRFCEDNNLISGAWIAGPGEATEAAVQAQTAYFVRTKGKTDRDWILQGFEHLKQLGPTARLFDERNPVWTHPISGDAATGLLDFWRRGPGVHSFVDDELDTRFLGDLYQDLSQHARKRYALLQTPEFVEEFILDLTLTPAIQEYGLEETSLIDPTCGSGHFLIGAFHRLHKLWLEREPGTDPRVRVQKALDQVTGVDINPFAVAIARFRLTIAALKACGETPLENAPGFRIRVATGDSLLRWGKDTSHQGDLLAVLEGRNEFAYFTEDGDLLAEYLHPGQYTVAVGNPPYITVKDKALNQRYRDLYQTCSGQYALSVPFAERFFQLVRPRDESGRAGFVGQITANSFMKREFGKKLIEEFLAHRVELSHIIDTSGAYIPGHGTPTVILIGRRRQPKTPTIRVALGIQGEPATPTNPAKGLVWTAILDQLDKPGSKTEYITVDNAPRNMFSRHPWSLAGGGALELKTAIEKNSQHRLSDAINVVGFYAITGEDDAFLLDSESTARRRGNVPTRKFVEGDEVRDYQLSTRTVSVWPYDTDLRPITPLPENIHRLLWSNRTLLLHRKRFGTPVNKIPGFIWSEYREFYRDRVANRWSIVFAGVSTHNHFVLDRGGHSFNRWAPVIKLPETASDDDHLGLLGLLNSSTACFWLKQVSHNKGVGGIGGGIGDEDWEPRYEFTGTKLQEFPLPAGRPLTRARALDHLAQRLAAVRPAVCADGVPSRKALDEARAEYERTRREMIAVQEELDWEVYRLYGLLDDDLTAPTDCVPELKLGERAFEIVLARRVAAGEAETQWFARHGSTPITEIPSHWPETYRTVVQRRIQIIEERTDIALIERPECKRRWAAVPWEEQEKAALRDWLLDRLEEPTLWQQRGQARALSVAQLADRIGTDEDFRSVLALYCGRDDYDLTTELVRLTDSEAVPYLAAYRYKPSGLLKRAVWERTWDLQRREDAGEKVGDIPVPPKYTQADFAKPSYWRNRGKLDVPKERFILYPKARRDADKTPVLGWAGWNHLDQADALANLYLSRKNDEGWPTERLLPLLAGLVELEPWLHQWHADPDEGDDESPAEYYSNFIDTELAALGFGRADLTADKLTEGTGTR
jgi:Predicted N6-adenine-specific DNA methylase